MSAKFSLQPAERRLRPGKALHRLSGQIPESPDFIKNDRCKSPLVSLSEASILSCAVSSHFGNWLSTSSKEAW